VSAIVRAAIALTDLFFKNCLEDRIVCALCHTHRYCCAIQSIDYTLHGIRRRTYFVTRML